jgi:hypothetical protein
MGIRVFNRIKRMKRELIWKRLNKIGIRFRIRIRIRIIIRRVGVKLLIVQIIQYRIFLGRNR